MRSVLARPLLLMGTEVFGRMKIGYPGSTYVQSMWMYLGGPN
jgi:hypothetical protein